MEKFIESIANGTVLGIRELPPFGVLREINKTCLLKKIMIELGIYEIPTLRWLGFMKHIRMVFRRG